MASTEDERPAASTAAEAGEAEAQILTHRLGFIAGVEDGVLLVDFHGNRSGPLRARSTVAMDAATAIEAALRRQEALLAFDCGDPSRPIVVGLVQAPLPTLIDLVLLDAPVTPLPSPSAQEEERTAVLDGKRILLEGEDEVVLRCGEASITLRRNGKIVIRGAYVESHAAGTNRIKGGSVRIN